MSVNLPSHYVLQFSTNIQLLLQQKGSKLRGMFTEGAYVGEQASPVDQIGAIEAQEVTTRFAPMGRVDAPVDRRWVVPSSFDLPQMVDSIDKLKLITDPESALVQNAVMAMGRKIDTLAIQAFMGTAKTGKQGGTSTSFTAGNEVDVAVGGTNSALNVAKLRAAKKGLMANHVDFDNDQVFVGITAVDHDALLNEIQIISSDFAGRDTPVLQSGKVTSFLGFQFVHCELIETVAAGTNEVNLPVWAKSGMHLGFWNDITVDISQRKDLQSMPWQAYVYASFGATRLDEKKVWNIESYRA
jgi:hypothetical protein